MFLIYNIKKNINIVYYILHGKEIYAYGESGIVKRKSCGQAY